MRWNRNYPKRCLSSPRPWKRPCSSSKSVLISGSDSSHCGFSFQSRLSAVMMAKFKSLNFSSPSTKWLLNISYTDIFLSMIWLVFSLKYGFCFSNAICFFDLSVFDLCQILLFFIQMRLIFFLFYLFYVWFVNVKYL